MAGFKQHKVSAWSELPHAEGLRTCASFQEKDRKRIHNQKRYLRIETWSLNGDIYVRERDALSLLSSTGRNAGSKSGYIGGDEIARLGELLRQEVVAPLVRRIDAVEMAVLDMKTRPDS